MESRGVVESLQYYAVVHLRGMQTLYCVLWCEFCKWHIMMILRNMNLMINKLSDI